MENIITIITGGQGSPVVPIRPTLRQAVTNRVGEYSEVVGCSTHETWSYLYKRLYHLYGVNPYRICRKEGESLLDALERYGQFDRLDNLVRAELDYYP